MDPNRPQIADSERLETVLDSSLEGNPANTANNLYGGSVYNPGVEAIQVHQEGVPVVERASTAPHATVLSRRKAATVSLIITLVITFMTGLGILLIAQQNPPSQTDNQIAKPQDITLNNTTISQLPKGLEINNNTLVVNGDTVTRGNLQISSGGYVTILRNGNLTSNQAVSLPNSSGTICLDSNNCGYATQAQLGQIVTTTVPASSLVNNQAGAVTIQGTTNQISVTTTAGTITLSTSQDLATISSPTFVNLLLNGTLTLPLNCTTFLNGGSLTTNGSGQVICADDETSGAGTSVTTPGGTPGTIPVFTAADVIADSIISQALGTITINGDLAVNGLLGVSGAGVSVINDQLFVGDQFHIGPTYDFFYLDNSGGNPIVSFDANDFIGYDRTSNRLHTTIGASIITSVTNIGLGIGDPDPAYSLTVGNGDLFGVQGTDGSLIWEGTIADASETVLTVVNPTADITYRLPDNTAGTYNICVSSGNCAGAGSGVTTSGGTANRLAKFSAAQNIENSTISDDGTNVTTTVDLIIQGGDATVGTTSQQGSLILSDGSSNTGTIRIAAHSADRIYTIPSSSADDSFCLLTLGNCFGAGSGGTLQAAYDAGNTITGSTGRNISITLADLATDQTLEITQAGTADAFRVNDDGTFSDTTPFVIDASGNVGIGTTTPGTILDITGDGGQTTRVTAYGGGPTLSLRRAQGTTALPTAVTNGNFLGTINGSGYDGSAFTTGAQITMSVAANWSGVSRNSQISFSTTSGTTLSERLRLHSSGALALGDSTWVQTSGGTGALTVQDNIGIGDSSPAYALTVGNGDLFGVQGADGSLIWEGTSADTSETVLTVVNPTADLTYRLADAVAGTYDLCSSAGNCLTGGGAATLQSAYNAGNTITGTTGRNISITLADLATDQTLEVTQAGTAHAFRVNDDGTFADSTPFVIDSSGNVGVGTTTPTNKLQVAGGDNKDTGPIISLVGNATNQVESGRLRFLEANTSYQGGYIHYDGSINKLHIGVHAIADLLTASDLNAITIDRANKYVGINTSSSTSTLEILQLGGSGAGSQDNVPALTVTGTTLNTGLSSSTEASHVIFDLAKTSTFVAGALATQRAFQISAPTYAFQGASTLTDAVTVAISGAPVKGTNATLTNTYALKIAGGAVGAASNAYGLYVDAPTGASNNYGAVFSSGNVGIGDTTPAYLLTVGNGDLFGVQGADGSLIWEGTSADASETVLTVVNPTADVIYRLADASAGTYDLCSSAGNCLTGGGAATLQSAYNAGNTITGTTGRNISITLADLATDQTLEVTQAGTADAFRVNDDGTFSDSTPFVINQDGNVGIGTSSPSTAKLVVSGTAVSGVSLRLEDTTEPLMQLSDGVDFVSYMGANASGDFLWLGSDITNRDDLVVKSGNVGIGTNNPANILHVKRDADSPTVSYLENTNGGTGAFASLFVRNGTSDSDAFFFGTSGTGFTSGGTTLQDAGFIIANSNLSGGLSIETRAAADIRFATNGNSNERMRITSGGNVGIGSTNPSSFKLQAAGHIGPETDDTYDLGSSTLRFRDLYLGPTSLHIQSTAAETTTARDYKFSIQETAGATQGNVRLLEGASELLTVTPTGNVGIGDTTPTEGKLRVLGTTGTVFSVEGSNSNFNLVDYDGAFNLNNQLVFQGGLRISGNTLRGEANGTGMTLGYKPANQTATDALFISQYGNVSVGTSTSSSLFQVNQPSTGTGTVTTNGTTALVGTNTRFTETFRVGDRITVSGETVRTIATITDNTNLTVTVAFSTSTSGLAYTVTDAGTVLKVEGNGRVSFLPPNGITGTGGYLDSSTRYGSSDSNAGAQFTANGALLFPVGGANVPMISIQGITSLHNESTNATAGNIIGSRVMSDLSRTATLVRGYTGLTGAILNVQDASSNSRLFVRADGNVGIGTATPNTFKLEVAGSIGPSADDTYDLGSSSLRWRNLYLDLDADGLLKVDQATGQVSIASIGGGNLVRNSSFETGTDGWSQTGGNAFAQTGSGLYGANRLYLGMDFVDVVANTPTGTSGIPVRASTSYTGSFWEREDSPTGVSTFIRLAWYDSGGAFISNSDSVSDFGGGTSWKRFKVTATSPSNAAYVSVQAYFDNPGQFATYIDGVMLEEGDVLRSYYERNNSLQDIYQSNGGSLSLVSGQNLTVTSPDAGTDPNVVINLQCTTCSASGGQFSVQNTGTDVFTIANNSSSTSAFLFKSKTNSTAAFQVQPSGATTPIFNIDTINDRVGIGTATPAVPLHVSRTSAGEAFRIQTSSATIGFSSYDGDVNTTDDLVINSGIRLSGSSRTVRAEGADTTLNISGSSTGGGGSLFGAVIITNNATLTGTGNRILNIQNNGTGVASFDKDGNLALGSSSAALETLQVVGGASIGSAPTTATTVSDNPLTSGATTVNVASTASYPSVGTLLIDNELMTYTNKTGTSFTGVTRGRYGTTAASHTLGTSVNINLLNVSSGSLTTAPKLVVQSTGNVGIGTATPGTFLDIQGTGGSGTGYIHFRDTINISHAITGVFPSTAFGKIGKYIQTDGGLLVSGVSDSDSTSGLALFGAIGSTNPTDTTPAILLSGGRDNGANDVTTLGSLETVLQVQNAGTAQLTILGSGNVGIGTASPTANLHIKSTTADVSATLESTGGGGTASLYFKDISGGTWQLQADNSHEFRLWDGATKRIFVTGNVSSSVEYPSFSVSATTLTVTAAIATQRFNLFSQPTVTAGSALTVTDSATLAIAGAPIEAGSATITNTHGLLIQSGAVGTAVNSYGLTVNAQTGATNNYAGSFLGGNVGIGTTTPTELLHVAGNILVGPQADSTAHTFASGCSCIINTSSTAGTIDGDASLDGAFSSAIYNGKLYIATRENDNSAIYRYDGSNTWVQVTDSTDGKIISGDADKVDASVLMVYNGKLYAGTQTGLSGTGNEGAIYAYDGSSWTLVQTTRGTFGSQTNIDGVSSMAVWNGQIFALTQEINLAAVYRYDGNNATWAMISGAAGKFGSADTNADMDSGVLIVFNNSLYGGASTNNSTSRVRRYTGAGWTDVNQTEGSFVSGITGVDDVTAMAVYDGQLFVAANDTTLNQNNIYYYRGGDGQSATPFALTTTTTGRIDANDATDVDSVPTMAVYNGKLYAGSDTSSTTGAVFEYTGPVGGTDNMWVKVNATRGTFGSQTNVPKVSTLIAYNGTMYVGTENTNAGSVYTFSSISGSSYALKFNSDATNTNFASILFKDNLQASGNERTTGSFVFSNAIVSSTGAYDIAEDYPTRDDSLKPGDLVAVDPNERSFVRRADSATAGSLLGIYSAKPGLHLSQVDETIDGARAIPIALVGRVPARVSTENGPIRAGDPITISSVPGVGAIATKSTRIVGTALESFDGSGVGIIQIHVSTGWYAPSSTEMLQGQLNVTDLNVSGEATIANLTVTGNLTVGGKLTVVGDVEVANLYVNGKLISKGAVPQITAGLSLQAVLGASVSVSGTDTAGTTELIIGTNVPAGGELVEVTFSSAFGTAPKIVISGNNKKSAKLGAYVIRTASGFKIISDDPLEANTTYSFDYIIIEAQNP